MEFLRCGQNRYRCTGWRGSNSTYRDSNCCLSIGGARARGERVHTDELFRASRGYSLVGIHSLVQLCTLIWSKCSSFNVRGCSLLL